MKEWSKPEVEEIQINETAVGTGDEQPKLKCWWPPCEDDPS